MELTTEPFPGRLPVRPVAASVSETMRESCKPRLVAAIGPRMSSATVRRVPTGETCALCCRVGAKRSNQTPKASTQIIRTRGQGNRTRVAATSAETSSVGGVVSGTVRTGSR